MSTAPTNSKRLLSETEQTVIDRDEELPFGHFTPDRLQAALIALAKNTPLHRGAFRRRMTKLITGSPARMLDVRFRGCAYRLRDPGNLIENGILLHPRYNAADIDFLLEGVGPGGTFVDIGANIGLYTLPLAKRIGENGKVIAIDANPLMARRLRWNAAASALGNISVFPCAVSDHEGSGSLSIHKDDAAIVSLEDDIEGSIPIRTLPSILAEARVEHIDGLKIDIEGHEDRVLAPFIETCEPALLPGRIVIEHLPGNVDYPTCATAFAKRGYRLAGRSRNNSFYLRD